MKRISSFSRQSRDSLGPVKPNRIMLSNSSLPFYEELTVIPVLTCRQSKNISAHYTLNLSSNCPSSAKRFRKYAQIMLQDEICRQDHFAGQLGSVICNGYSVRSRPFRDTWDLSLKSCRELIDDWIPSIMTHFNKTFFLALFNQLISTSNRFETIFGVYWMSVNIPWSSI